MGIEFARLSSAVAGRYRVERELGRGGTATVFLAEDLKHHRQVAIKVLDPELAAAIGADRFVREIEVTARIDHPHILPLLDSGEAGGLFYYVMPYVEGESLRDRLNREKQLPLDDALQIVRQVADALSYAHGRGVVHRDIKPENILLAAGNARVADFGIARAISATGGTTATGITVGTPAYMSPEQAVGSQDLDGRSDLYSLGCVLFEMLAGQPPFTGPTGESVVYQHMTVEPPSITALRPAVPGWLAAMLSRALAKTPADRFTTASRFTEALARHETHLAQAAATHERTAIAVLPLQNLSPEGPHAYFAGGLHDELLTQLTKVAALRVISRTSVMGYAGTKIPLKQIASELGVGSVVEGTVQVLGERLRVNVQLIDAATDQHRWAERYDRTLDDAFAIQSDVAQRIVEAVGAVLGESEGQLIADAPTANAEAYRLYLQGREFHRRPGFLQQNFEHAQRIYEHALSLDPGFALAHAALSQVHGAMHWWRYDPTPARIARQREEAEEALRLAPGLPQAHLAMGLAHYWGRGDYLMALAEYDIALRGLPNDALLWARIGRVNRRLGNWARFFDALERAIRLDPRDANLHMDLGVTFLQTRDYADAARTLNRALALAPDLHEAAVWNGWTDILWQGNLDTLRAVLDRLPPDATFSGGIAGARAQRAMLLLWERRADRLLELLASSPGQQFESQLTYRPTSLFEAWAHQLAGDRPAAQAAYESTRVQLDSAMAESPDDWRVHAARGLAFAGLGHRAEALEEARWLERSVTYRTDAMDGTDVAEDRARILSQAGEANAALDEIERLLAAPSLLSVHTLRFDPLWDPIRQHPRFQELLARYSKP